METRKESTAFIRARIFIAAHSDNISFVWKKCDDGRYRFAFFTGCLEEKGFRPYSVLLMSDSVVEKGYASKRKMKEGFVDFLKTCKTSFENGAPKKLLLEASQHRQRPFLSNEIIQRLVKKFKPIHESRFIDSSISARLWSSKFPKWLELFSSSINNSSRLLEEARKSGFYV